MQFGTLQVIQLAETPGADGEYLTEQQRWTNLGPIVDFVVVDLERQAAVTEPLHPLHPLRPNRRFRRRRLGAAGSRD